MKPSNVMLVATGGAKVLDFGTARVGAASTMGMTGFTPMYAAPEQWDSGRFGPTGPRTDVFALGLIVAEMATLALPSPRR